VRRFGVRFIIYGPGAVGGTIAGNLAVHGHDVALIARGAHRAAIVADGLRLRSPDRDHVVRVPVVEHPGELALGDGDVVVLAMKTQDTEAALTELAAVAPPELPLVCAQNGVENERLALRRFASVHAMCVMLPATFLEPGVVVAHGAPLAGILDVGRYPGGVDDVTRAVAGALDGSGFSSEPDPSVMRRKYAKLLMNLGNALEAASGAEGRSSTLASRAKREALACYAAAGIDAATAEEDAARRGDLVRIAPVEGVARGGGSSWQSLARGAGTVEADHLNGEVVLLGRLHGVPTPVNELLQRTANRMARNREAPGSVPVAELEAALEDQPRDAG
jgi:2-dehydropantoate 2-reductase